VKLKPTHVALLVVAVMVAAGAFVYFWSRRKLDVRATVTSPEDEITITRVIPTNDGAIYVD
jgi:hypothetical protein